MKNKQKLLLVGWDAADWQIIGPLLAKGLMPSLKKIIDNGVYGNMSTMNPPYSPMLWTSVATGFLQATPRSDSTVVLHPNASSPCGTFPRSPGPV